MLFEIANLPYILLTAGAIVAIFAVIPLLEKQGSLDSFKSRPVETDSMALLDGPHHRKYGMPISRFRLHHSYGVRDRICPKRRDW